MERFQEGLADTARRKDDALQSRLTQEPGEQ
jgi:hypothetical protein